MLHSLDRQKKILENLSFDHVTSIHYLCRKTQFNESTIRRDIKLLEQEKKVIIVRGGVIPIKVNEITPLFIENLKEKTNNCIKAEIINASYVGNSYQYVVSSSVGELFIVSNETINHFKLNEEVFITFDESGITILED